MISEWEYLTLHIKAQQLWWWEYLIKCNLDNLYIICDNEMQIKQNKWLATKFCSFSINNHYCHKPSPSPKSKGLGVTLFCCATHHQPITTQPFLSNQTSNWAQIKIKNSASKFYSGLWQKVESNSSIYILLYS